MIRPKNQDQPRGFVVMSGSLTHESLASTPPNYRHNELKIYYHGFIANRTALRHERSRLGLPPDDRDSALMAVAYRKWGYDLQAHVLGEYAVVFSDSAQGSLFATHDGLGIIPLFYARTPQGIVIASHLEDLARTPCASVLDELYIAEYLALGEARLDRTPYRDIRRLLPGRSLECKYGAIHELKTWDLGMVPPLVLPGEQAYEERLRELLMDGVRTAVPQGTRAWVELSGGLDSSSVACAAKRSGITDVEALSIVFSRTRRADETEWIEAVLEACPMPWHALDGDDMLPYSELPDYFCPEPTPLHCESAAFRIRNELLAAHKVDVLLTGLGGDEVFFGYSMAPLYLADLLRQGSLRWLLHEARQWSLSGRTHRSPLYWLVKYAVAPTTRQVRRSRTVLAPEVSRAPWITPAVSELARDAETDYRPVFSASSVARRGFADAVMTDVRAAQGIASMAKQFSHRHPLLYRPLVEFMTSIPFQQQQRPGQARPLQRRALAGLIPESVRLRIGKVMWDGPRHAGFQRASTWVQLLTEEPRLVERGMVDANEWRNTVSRARFGYNAVPLLFDAAASLEIWLRQPGVPGQ